MLAGGMVTLFVRDVPSSIRFYVETLGMKLVEEEPRWAVIDAGDGLRVGLQAGTPAAADGSAQLGFFPKLPIAEAIAILENRGVTFEIRDDGGAKIAKFHDPDGNRLSLREPGGSKA